MRKTVAAMIGAAAMLGAGPALAQQTFGPQGTAAFSGDRLFGMYAGSEEVETPGGDFETDYTSFGFAWQGPSHFSPFTVPRLGFDYFVIDSLSIGGSIAYATYDVDPPGPPEAEGSAFIFAPRVGYVWMFSDVIGFWLRGGFTYHSYDNEGIFAGDESGFAFTADPMFVITPTAHFGFVLGPVIDFTITGERETGAGDVDVNYANFGIAMGPMGWF
jgi:hypothetical protein